MLTLMCLNVATLSRRLETLLGLGFDLLILSEVRATEPQQHSMARRAKRFNYGVVWSSPPPSSRTFAIMPGGVAILAKKPVALTRVRPAALAEWEGEGRVCSAKIVLGSFSMLLVSVYGYPHSHPRCRDNDALLRQVFTWIAEQTLPVLMGGDLNVSIGTSEPLSLVHRLGLWRITDDMPTTMAKSTGRPTGPPIDHIVCNAKMLDLQIKAKVSYSIPMSDHFPILADFHVRHDNKPLVWVWPKPMRCDEVKNPELQWEEWATTYTEWAEMAATWLAKACDTTRISKNRVTSLQKSQHHVDVDPRYALYLKAQGMVSRCRREETDGNWQRLCDRLHELSIERPNDVDHAEKLISASLTTFFRTISAEALAAWRERESRHGIQLQPHSLRT